MDGNITINIVEPGSVVPVPDTGLSTTGIDGATASILVTIAVVVIIAIATILHLRKKKISLKPSKRTSTILGLLVIITSIGTFTGLTLNSIYNNTNAEEGTLTVNAEDADLTIELGDEPVFAVLPVDVTVEEATEAGYTLTAYADSTDLVSTTDSSKVIPMVAADEGELVALTNNTYGLALDEKPTTKDEAVYTSLSIDPEEPTILKSMPEYTPTEANNTTTIYYGFYITPDVPYGTYTGSTISYEAIPNLATISYNANGLYYNNDDSFTTNTVGYKPSTPDSPIEELSGEYLTPAPLNPDSSSSPIHYTFLGWSKTEGATTPDYEDEEDIIASLTLSPNEDLTLYAVWHYDTVLSFNGNTSDGGEAIADITIPAGTTITLPPNTYTRTGSVFTNWNTVAIPTEQDPGEDYEDEADFTAPDSSADITLYAQWAYYTTITFNGNGETSGYMSPQDIIAGTPENLVPNAFTRTNHTFIGWNTQANGSGTSYSDEAEFIASSTQHEDITLYAQWAATTISFNGNTSESGTMNPITIAGGQQTTLPQNTYTKSHCTFTSWNTNPDGTGTRYPGEASYTASMDGIYSFTLYAQWQCESMINFNGNGADSGYMPGIMATGGQQTTLPQNTFTKDGYSFNGWNTKADGTGESYPDQGTYIAPVSESQNVTLYAQWKQVFYMQDVATWGSTLSQGDTMEAVDKRDGKTYYVSRLADNKIWMTQNLDLELSTEKTLTPADTNITADWTPVNSTISFTGTSVSGWQNNNYVPYSADPGDVYYYTSNIRDNDIKYNSLAECEAAGHTDCAHYHAGNYYNWSAAVASNDTSSLSTQYANAPGSICPAGWRLPTGTDSRNTAASREWNAVLYAEGVASSPTGDGYTPDGLNKIRTAPLWLARSGHVSNGSLYSTGGNGLYWSSTVYVSSSAYSLYSYTYNMSPAILNSRSLGYSVRCVTSARTTITFDGNGADSGSMSDQTIVAGTSQNLTPNAFAKEGYAFNGWNTNAEGTGTSYADQAEYTAAEGETKDVTLYAQWEKMPSMQDVADWGSKLEIGDEIIAVDNRDNKGYYVARLADGNIWMTQNLDLDLISDPTAEGYVALTPANTNIVADWTPANSTISFTGTSVPGWQSSTTAPYSADPGDVYYYSSGTTSNDKQYTSLEACKEAHSDCSAKNYAGNYYNWSAAVANNNTAGITERYTNAKTSICPAGWRLPTGTDSDDTAASREWNAVLYAEGVVSGPTGGSYTSDGFNKIRTAPLWLVRSGSVRDGSLSGTGRSGFYWSSTVDSSSRACGTSFYSESVGPVSYGSRNGGYPVRCVAQ